MKKISIGICCYNEEENILETYEKVNELTKACPEYCFEILFEDNASNDNTQFLLKEIAQKDKRVKIIINQINYGIEKSAVNLRKHISGEAFIGLPCDLQEPIEELPRYIRLWDSGHYDAVLGQKVQSDESWIKYKCRSLYYHIINRLSDVEHLQQCDGFGVIDSKIMRNFLRSAVQDPYYDLRHWMMQYGCNIKLIPYHQRKREHGKSSYNLSKSLDFAITSLCNTSTKPLRLMTILGLSVGFFCMVVAFSYFIYKLLHWESFAVGIAPLLIGLFFVASVLLFCIGMLGEYVTIVLRRITVPIPIHEKELINFDSEEQSGD